jgi:site-specific recombinase XerD
MPRTAELPRIVRWKGDYHLFLTDGGTGNHKRIRCQAVGAVTPAQRRALVKKHTEAMFAAHVLSLQHGSEVAFDTPLADDLKGYLGSLAERSAARLANPNAREGLAPKSARLAGDSVRELMAWLPAGTTTGALDQQTLGRFFVHASGRGLATATLNLHRRNVRTALGWVNDLRPRRLPDFQLLVKACRPAPCSLALPSVYSPAQLQAFHRASCVTRQEVRRTRFGRVETYLQKVRQPSTPIDRLFLLLALTGVRLGEALGLKWSDVDLERGRLTIHAQKTGRPRVVPLVGAREGVIAPGLLDLLRVWRRMAPGAVYVLPCKRKPVLIRRTWDTVGRAAGVKITPQGLRKNWISYAASTGCPATVVAGWAGHSPIVMARYYLGQAVEARPGVSIQDAMGLLVG